MSKTVRKPKESEGPPSQVMLVPPWLVYVKGTFTPEPGRMEVILVELSKEDDLFWASMPQFDIEVSGTDQGELFTLVCKRLLSFYAGLTELPKESVSEVQEVQRQLVEDLFLPWFAQAMVKAPQYFVLPPWARQAKIFQDFNLVSA